MDPARQAVGKAYSLLEEFKNFAFKGNVVDLAVGVIIGSAFGKIVDSLVKDVIMPLLSIVVPSDKGYKEWAPLIAGKEIKIGLFVGELVNFTVVAFAIYIIIVKFLGFVLKTKKETAPPPPTKDQELLMEIRDLLRKNAA